MMSELKYATVIVKLGKDRLELLEKRAKVIGITVRQYVERQEQLRLDQKLVSKAVWIDLRAPVAKSLDKIANDLIVSNP